MTIRRLAFLEHLAEAYNELDRQTVIVSGTVQLMRDNRAEEGDGYRLVNAMLDIRSLAEREQEFCRSLLEDEFERNAGFHVMAFRAWWAILAARLDAWLADFPGTSAMAPVQEAISAIREVRKDMEALAR